MLLLVAACKLVTREVDKPQCVTNANCGETQLCFESACTEVNRVPIGPLYVSITPNTQQRFFAQQQVAPQNTSRMTLTWTGTSELRGRPRLTSGSGFANIVGGILHLQREPIIPGIAQRFDVDLGETSEYVVYLEPGTYRASFTSLARDGRPEYALDDIVMPVGEQVDAFAPSTISVKGALKASASDPSPRIDALVYAAADDTGLLSTISTSKSDGTFELLLAGAPSGATIFIRPSADNPFLPSLSLHVDLPSATTTLADIYIPDLGSTATLTGLVHGSLSQNCRVPLATVTAETNVGGGVYRSSTTTDSAAQFTLPVLRGSGTTALQYTITVQPRSGNVPACAEEFGRATLSYTLASSGTPDPLVVVLPLRPSFSGTIVNHDGAPATGVTVSARPLDGTGTIGASTRTDAQGLYVLRLDRGTYELTAVPVPGSRAARLRSLVEIIEDEDIVDFTLPVPAFVAGELVSNNELSFTGALIQFYDENAGLVGEAYADKNAHFSVVLPAP